LSPWDCQPHAPARCGTSCQLVLRLSCHFLKSSNSPVSMSAGFPFMEVGLSAARCEINRLCLAGGASDATLPFQSGETDEKLAKTLANRGPGGGSHLPGAARDRGPATFQGQRGPCQNRSHAGSRFSVPACNYFAKRFYSTGVGQNRNEGGCRLAGVDQDPDGKDDRPSRQHPRQRPHGPGVAGQQGAADAAQTGDERRWGNRRSGPPSDSPH